MRIPPHAPDMEVLEGTVVHDMGCSVRLLSFWRNAFRFSTNKPELWKDEAYRHRFFIKSTIALLRPGSTKIEGGFQPWQT